MRIYSAFLATCLLTLVVNVVCHPTIPKKPVEIRYADLVKRQSGSATPSASAPAGTLTATATLDNNAVDNAAATPTTTNALSVLCSADPSASGCSTSSSTTSTTTTSSSGGSQASLPPGRLNQSDPTVWCNAVDTNDPVAVAGLWENQGVGYWFDNFLQEETNPVGYNWPYVLVSSSFPNPGDTGTEGCGDPEDESGCAIALDYQTCQQMVESGHGIAYWVLVALKNFHEKLTTAHEALQDTTIDDNLDLATIASQFSQPTSFDTAELAAGIISASLFLAGGIGAVGSAAASFASTAEKAAVGVAEAEAARAAAAYDQGIADGSLTPAQLVDLGVESKAATARAAAYEARAGNYADASGAAGATSAGIYLVGSVFSEISANAAENGQITSDDLAPTLQSLFETATSNLKELGGLAVGTQGGNYSFLPSQDGITISYKTPIAGFFGDGKQLLSPDNASFNQTIQQGYNQFKAKIVDQALITANYQVLADTTVTNADDCGKLFYGSQWVPVDGIPNGGLCMELYENVKSASCKPPIGGTQNYACTWIPASKTNIDSLQNDYGFNMEQYYANAYSCNTQGPANRTVDIVNIPANGDLPLCWYSIQAQAADIEYTQEGTASLQSVSFSSLPKAS